MGGDDKFSSGAFDDPKHIVDGPGLTRTLYSVGTGAFCGTIYGTCIAAWYPDPIQSVGRYASALPGRTDYRAVARTVMRPAMWFSLVAGTFTATECAMEAARSEVKDPWNSLVAGMAGGAVIGLTTGRPQIVAAAAIGMGLFMAAVDISGPTTVYDEPALNYKRMGVLPKQHVESDALVALKEKYPQHKNL